MPFRMPKRAAATNGARAKDDLEPLRERVKAAMKKDGVATTAGRIGVQPATLQRFIAGVCDCHKGTVSLIRAEFGS